MRSRATTPTLYLACLTGALAALALHTTVDLGGQRLDGLFDGGVYNVLMLGSALAVLARAFTVDRQRGAWLALGAGVLCWSVGELYYSLFIEGTSAEAGGTVSPADVFYLAMYPCFYVGLGLLARDHLRPLPIGIWLNGVIGGLAAATVTAALILPPILDQARGDVGSIFVSSAYPIGDLLLALFAIGVLTITGWRPGRVWLLIAASMLLSVIADSAYLYQTATGSYRNGTWLDCLWPAAAVLIAIGAWTPSKPPQPRAMRGREMIVAPAIGLLSSVAVLVYGDVAGQLRLPVLALALATVLAVGAHLILTLRENLALLAISQRLSLTDPLTGLGNRRRLIADLESACQNATWQSPTQCVLYDLDGFKAYNDAFGHPAGDTLLARLSTRLAKAVEAHGHAYRMGGDEFCVLLERPRDTDALIEGSLQALFEQGRGYAITASHGAVLIPTEASDPEAVMQLADQRLYRRKAEVAAQRSYGDATIVTHQGAPSPALGLTLSRHSRP